MKRSVVRLAGIVLAVSLASGILTAARGAESSGTAAVQPAEWIKTEIYFGRDLPGGREISRNAWVDFMDKVVSHHFPKGFTVYDAYGQMQHADGRIEKQSTWVVAVVHPKDPAVDKAVQEIIDAFRKQFSKAQVVQVSAPVLTARFYAD